MYQRLPESQRRALREQFEARQEYMVAYNAINVVSEHYDDLSPEEIWNEALAIVDEISKSNHRQWKVDKVYSQLKRKYSTIVDEHGDKSNRTDKQQSISATLVLFDVVCMLSLAKRLEPQQAQQHPYYEYMRTLLGYFCHSVLFQAMLAVLMNDEEEVENLVGKELQEVDYMDAQPTPQQQPNNNPPDWNDHDLRIGKLRKIYTALQHQLGDQFHGRSQWFYVYRVMADLTAYQERSYTLFISDLREIGVNDENMPNTNTFSRKQDQLKTHSRYPNWQVKPGRKQTVLDEGIRIARIAFDILNA